MASSLHQLALRGPCSTDLRAVLESAQTPQELIDGAGTWLATSHEVSEAWILISSGHPSTDPPELLWSSVTHPLFDELRCDSTILSRQHSILQALGGSEPVRVTRMDPSLPAGFEPAAGEPAAGEPAHMVGTAGNAWVCPIRHGGEVFGLIGIAIHDDAPDPAAGLALLADQVARTMELFRLRDEVERTRQMLLTRDLELERLVHHAPLGIARWSFGGSLLQVNRHLTEMLGYTSGRELLAAANADPVILFADPATAADFTAWLRDAGAGTAAEWLLRDRQGTVRLVAVRAVLHQPVESLPGVIDTYLTDITDQRLRDEQTAATAERLSIASDAASIAIWDIVDVVGELHVSGAFCRMLGYAHGGPGQLDIDDWIELIHPDDRDHARTLFAGTDQAIGQSFRTELRVLHQDSSWRWMLVSGQTHQVSVSSRPARRIFGIMLDITADREREEAMETELRDTERLLRELHHRIGNNLSVVLGLLGMEQESEPGASDSAFLLTEIRIRVIASIHELVYSSARMDRVSLPALVETVAAVLQRTCERIWIEPLREDHRREPVYVSLDVAVPLGLAIADLFQRAHTARTNDADTDHMRLHLTRNPDGDVILAIHGLGHGIASPHQDLLNEFFLCHALLQQAGCRLELPGQEHEAPVEGTRTTTAPTEFVVTVRIGPDTLAAAPLFHGS